MKIKSNTVYVLLAVFIVITVFNSYMLFSLGTTQHTSTRKTVKLTGDPVQDAINTIIPTGAAEPYGSALGVSFDDPVAGLSVLANLHRQIPTDSLSAEEKQRYINIGTKISCEFCCSAPAVVDSSGRDLCGCAHAQSFMGLSKYLIQNTGLSDDEILWELTKWKSLYYPRNMVEKAAAALENGLELTPEVLNDRDLLKKIGSGNTADIGSLPQMVGGC